ncbi:MAG: cytochrome c [Gammaproteobacteria bacterium]|nr:cytochrome c [Gammaproteobacteria bacterium]
MRLLIILVALIVTPFARAEYDAQSFATCAACHLPDGVGVPGAFPPVRNRAAKIAALEGGREYLVTAVTYGLMGTIEVDGAQYFGVMAGAAGALSNADIAAALNYLVFDLNDGSTDSIEPFSADEVAAVQESTTVKSPAAAGQMRSDLAAKHADEWP